MPQPIGQPEWVQYGSFGLIAFLTIVGLPSGVYVVVQLFYKLQAANEATIKHLCDSFNQESSACREERVDNQRRAEEEREKDRGLRHELKNTIQQLVGVLHASGHLKPP